MNAHFGLKKAIACPTWQLHSERQVYGCSENKIQPGADRDSTRGWIAESIRTTLAETTAPKGVDVWLETHGDFASSSETTAILLQAISRAPE